MAEKVTLIVKAANQSSLDKRIEFDLNSNVQCLKEEISKTHPIKPSVQEQRLIYSGQLLQDSLLLKTVLRHPSDNNEYIIHLVCSSPKSGAIPKIAQKTPITSTLTQSSPVLETSESNSHHEASSEPSEGAGTVDGLRRRYVTSDQSPSGGIQQQDFNAAATTYPYYSQFSFPLPTSADPIQQMAAMQQMYSQYMMSYMQYMQSVNIEGGRIQPEATTLSQTQAPQANVTASENPTSNARPQNQNEEPNANNAQDGQRNAQMRVNPQAGPGEDEDDGVARDWLDYIYFGSRLVVLLSIVYFYSTFTRFMFVACTTVLIYMYQGGWFRFLGLEERPPQAATEPEPPVAENQGEDNTDPQPNAPPQPGPQTTAPPQPGPEEESESGPVETSEEERGVSSNSEPAEGRTSNSEPIMEALPPQPSILALSWTFLTTFFTSLIPEQHQIV